jgi:hypothetical protein
LKSSQQLVPSLSERGARINQGFYGSMEGQESMKDESQKIKMFKARNAMTEHKLKPWQEVERRQPRELKHKIKEANHRRQWAQT